MEPGEIRWYIDGKLYHVANDWYSRDPYLADDYTYPAPFDQNFFLILNISVGGGWPDILTKRQFSRSKWLWTM